jgi:hypothetical protein
LVLNLGTLEPWNIGTFVLLDRFLGTDSKVEVNLGSEESWRSQRLGTRNRHAS